MKYKENWEETKQKWEKYWKRENTGRPLMSIIAEKPEAMDAEKAARLKSVDVEDKYRNPERIVERFRYFCETHDFLAESFQPECGFRPRIHGRIPGQRDCV